jgi:2-oxoisovalerate dehydrogenase E1 component
VELIDARSLVPFNYEPVMASVKKTGRILLTSDANERGSYLKDMAHNITELCFDDLDAPPVVVGSRNWIIPAHELEDYYFPQAAWMVDAVHEKILPLKGHKVSNDFTNEKKIWRAARGI